MLSSRWRLTWPHLLLIAGALVTSYPLLWMISSALKPTNLIFSDPSLWPKQLTLEHFVQGWTALDRPFSVFFANSFLVCAGAVIGNLLSCSFAAYAFARLRFRFKAPLFAVMLGSIMLPYHVLIVPQYTLFHSLGWIDTFLPLIVPKFLATDAFFIFLLVQFFRGLSREIDEAARIDGCGPFGIYWRIILPLSVPALATTAIFTFIWTWSDFFGQLIFLTRPQHYTIPLALQVFMDATGRSDMGGLFAMSVLSLVPIFVIFLMSQRLLVEGVATTGLKG